MKKLCILMIVLMLFSSFSTYTLAANALSDDEENSVEEFTKLIEKCAFVIRATRLLPEKGFYADVVFGLYGVRMEQCTNGMTAEEENAFLEENGYIDYYIILDVYSNNLVGDIALLKARPEIVSITPQYPEHWTDVDVSSIKPDYKHLGDTNGNGKLDARDYFLAKRAYFGTYNLGGYHEQYADINGNGKIDARDYLLIKRAYFGTYTLGAPDATPTKLKNGIKMLWNR